MLSISIVLYLEINKPEMLMEEFSWVEREHGNTVNTAHHFVQIKLELDHLFASSMHLCILPWLPNLMQFSLLFAFMNC